MTRRLKEEPLIPLGCGLTVWALYSAAKSIRRGNNGFETNRYFRYRLYAQSFTLVAMLGGSFYYKSDRLKRNEYVKLKKEQEALAKRDKWIRELEAREAEDQAWRLNMGKLREAEKEIEERQKSTKMAVKQMNAAKSADQDTPSSAIKNAQRASSSKPQDLEGGPGVSDAPSRSSNQEQGSAPETNTIFGESHSGGLFGFKRLKQLWLDKTSGNNQNKDS